MNDFTMNIAGTVRIGHEATKSYATVSSTGEIEITGTEDEILQCVENTPQHSKFAGYLVLEILRLRQALRDTLVALNYSDTECAAQDGYWSLEEQRLCESMIAAKPVDASPDKQPSDVGILEGLHRAVLTDESTAKIAQATVEIIRSQLREVTLTDRVTGHKPTGAFGFADDIQEDCACPVCGAEIGQQCNEEDPQDKGAAIELGRYVHIERIIESTADEAAQDDLAPVSYYFRQDGRQRSIVTFEALPEYVPPIRGSGTDTGVIDEA